MPSLCVTTSVDAVDTLRNILAELQLNDPTRRLKFLKGENLVAIPIKDIDLHTEFCTADLKKKITSHEIYSIEESKVDIRTVNLPLAKKFTVKTPLQLLKEDLKCLIDKHGYEWTEDVVKDIPSHWERHGDLVLIPSTAFTLPVWTGLGSEVWSTVLRCLSCNRLAKKCPVSIDQYRTPQVIMLHGNSGWVEQTDNGIRYTYDVTKCMFSAGNITEKLRVAGFKCNGEIVVDLYAGIGYFTLPYLVYTGVKHLHACEWNPDAVEALRRNLSMNGVEDKCTVHLGDNKQVCPEGVADRVNLGLIPSSREGWPVACAALRPDTGGIMHIHYNVNTKPEVENGCHSDKPQQLFRCEAKSSRPVDTIPVDHKNAFHMTCQNISGNPELCNIQTDPYVTVGNAIDMIGSQPDSCVREEIVTDINDDVRRKASVVHEIGIDDKVREKTKNTNEIGDYIAEENNSFIGKANVTSGARNTEDVLTNINNEDTDQHKKPADKQSLHETCSDDKCSLENALSCNCERTAVNSECCKLSRNKSDNNKTRLKNSKWYSWAQLTAVEVRDMLQRIHGNVWNTDILHIEHVKSYAPYVDHVVLDLKCKPVV
ncbi:tRNA wybutosine-synthesizing protein 2 homolog [Mercenaria mercenaria]|uniref:tRNA wybutosine-synthesizing protein 2 homolog n=1 Tax=Mercenaria mercenaria TaxID=6596 RepID=UPI00234F2E42|nr:tRNA wybutosine-synthesizing protein 2 homolog [Mercenaria mercenaria]